MFTAQQYRDKAHEYDACSRRRIVRCRKVRVDRSRQFGKGKTCLTSFRLDKRSIFYLGCRE